MAKGNTGNTKEFVQCLAFAHFANNKYPNKKEDQEEHKNSFYKLFLTSTDRKKHDIKKLNLREYKEYLGTKYCHN